MSELLEFVEWGAFAQRRDSLLSDDEYRAMQDTLNQNPRFGPVIPGTGGCRKMRVRRRGTGVRGGSRVVYYFHDQARRIHLLMIFAKNEKTTLTADEARILEGLIQGAKVRRDL